MIKRSFDVFFSCIGLVILLPIFLIIAILIRLNSVGPIFFSQRRVGKNNIDFDIYKFRTMHINSQSKGLLTLGDNDQRITKVGLFLRRYKIDELPQFINIFMGHMSFVGPRPELRHYVDYYKEEDYIVFSVKPGITGLASLKYKDEANLLSKQTNPEGFYIDHIIPDKLKLNKEYINKHNFLFDLKLILLTITKVFTK